MSYFTRIRRKNFWFHRRIIRLKRKREIYFPRNKPNKPTKLFTTPPPFVYRYKSVDYNETPIRSKKDNQAVIIRRGGNDRDDDWYYHKPGRDFCTECNHSQIQMNTRCVSCGADDSKIVRLSHEARVPKKNSNKKTWKNFRRAFVDYLLERKKIV